MTEQPIGIGLSEALNVLRTDWPQLRWLQLKKI